MEPWVTLAEAREIGGVCGSCAEASDELLTSMLDAATDALYLMSGRQFPGLTSATVLPAGSCSFIPVIGRNGSWYGGEGSWAGVRRYGWDRSSGCCGSNRGVHLGAVPIVSVEEVVLDGEVLHPDEYRVDDYRLLVRENGRGWPCCPQPDAFSVTFTYGAVPPQLGRQAVIDLACELALARCQPSECGLNRRVTQVARQGVTIQMPGLVDALADGRTGVVTVDLFLHSTNPNGLRRRGRVLSPDRHNVRRIRTA